MLEELFLDIEIIIGIILDTESIKLQKNTGSKLIELKISAQAAQGTLLGQDHSKFIPSQAKKGLIAIVKGMKEKINEVLEDEQKNEKATKLFEEVKFKLSRSMNLISI